MRMLHSSVMIQRRRYQQLSLEFNHLIRRTCKTSISQHRFILATISITCAYAQAASNNGSEQLFAPETVDKSFIHVLRESQSHLPACGLKLLGEECCQICAASPFICIPGWPFKYLYLSQPRHLASLPIQEMSLELACYISTCRSCQANLQPVSQFPELCTHS